MMFPSFKMAGLVNGKKYTEVPAFVIIYKKDGYMEILIDFLVRKFQGRLSTFIIFNYFKK